MNTLIVYDSEGYIIYQASGDIREPVGVPFMWIEVPAGKRLVGIDVTAEQHVPVFEDLPKSQEAEIAELKQSILELSMIVGGAAQ